tara:strand:+ start:50 stop:202 length:153 start_codon:yes stop_codon:yes gene_type:complete
MRQETINLVFPILDINNVMQVSAQQVISYHIGNMITLDWNVPYTPAALAQ